MAKRPSDVQRTPRHANYPDYLEDHEKQRLSVLDERIERRVLILADDYAERKRLMNRAIRRMQRAKSKETIKRKA